MGTEVSGVALWACLEQVRVRTPLVAGAWAAGALVAGSWGLEQAWARALGRARGVLALTETPYSEFETLGPALDPLGLAQERLITHHHTHSVTKASRVEKTNGCLKSSTWCLSILFTHITDNEEPPESNQRHQI